MEGFRQLRHTGTQIKCEFLSYIARISALHKTEICGLLTDSSLFFVKNISPSPLDTFFIDPAKHIEVLGAKKIDFCFHSHPANSATPSKADIDLSDNALIPFLIFSVLEKQFALYDPNTQQTIYFLI